MRSTFVPGQNETLQCVKSTSFNFFIRGFINVWLTSVPSCREVYQNKNNRGVALFQKDSGSKLGIGERSLS